MKKTLKVLIIIFISLICSLKDIKADKIAKVYFEGNINNMTSKADERKIKITYISTNLNFDAYALIKVQGSSSLSYDKKNYTINLYEDEEYNIKKKINVGFGEQSKYCLKANWIDKTHARNIVTARITSKIQDKYNLFENTPNNGLIDGFPVEIYINNKFLGIYTWNIPKDTWMFNMNENNPNHIVLSGKTNSEATSFNTTTTFDDWEVEAGPETEETLKKFNRLINFINNSTDKEFKDNFEKYLNLDATLNYYVMLNFAELLDNPSKNMLMVTYDGKIWYPSLYDLDTSWGTTTNGKGIYDYNITIEEHAKNNALWVKFQKNFPNEIADRYFELRKEILTKENILNEFNTFINTIPESSLTLEQKRWKNIPGYDITQIEEFLNTRIPLTDELMHNLYNIIPNIKIKYSNTNITTNVVTASLIPNRNDITILKNNKATNNYNYIFTKNGEYNIKYIDWNGDIGTITLKVNWIIEDKIINISIAIIIITTGTTLLYLFQKKKDTPNKNYKQNNYKQSNSKKNKQNKKYKKKSPNPTAKKQNLNKNFKKKQTNYNQKNNTNNKAKKK